MLPLPGVPSKQCYHCLPETKFKFDTSELAQLALPLGSVVVWLSPPKQSTEEDRFPLWVDSNTLSLFQIRSRCFWLLVSSTFPNDIYAVYVLTSTPPKVRKQIHHTGHLLHIAVTKLALLRKIQLLLQKTNNPVNEKHESLTLQLQKSSSSLRLPICHLLQVSLHLKVRRNLVQHERK